MNRRGFLTGLLYTPAVITTPGLLMPVRAWEEPSPDAVMVHSERLYFNSSTFRFVNWSWPEREAFFIVRGNGENVSWHHA